MKSETSFYSKILYFIQKVCLSKISSSSVGKGLLTNLNVSKKPGCQGFQLLCMDRNLNP